MMVLKSLETKGIVVEKVIRIEGVFKEAVLDMAQKYISDPDYWDFYTSYKYPYDEDKGETLNLEKDCVVCLLTIPVVHGTVDSVTGYYLVHKERGLIRSFRGEDPVLLLLAYMRYGTRSLLTYLTQWEENRNESFLSIAGVDRYDVERRLLKERYKVV